MLAQPLAHAAGAHEHGVASLNVARSGSELLIELDSPLDNFVGFEHAPGNAEQKRRLADALAVLRDPARVVSLPDAAACRLVEAEVDDPFAPHDDHHHEEADGHEDGELGHADLEASWHFECANAAALVGFDVELWAFSPPWQAACPACRRQGSRRGSSSPLRCGSSLQCGHELAARACPGDCRSRLRLAR